MAKKLIRLISLCMVFMMVFMASLQGNAYAYKNDNINWPPGHNDVSENELGDSGKISTRSFGGSNLSADDWKFGGNLFSGVGGKVEVESFDSIEHIDQKSTKVFWGYIKPKYNGRYKLGVDGVSGHFGMLFNSTSAISNFVSNREYYYQQSPGYEADGALVISNLDQPGLYINNSSEMDRFVDLKKDVLYPVYIESYNCKNDYGYMGLYYRYKNGNGNSYEISARVGSANSYIDVYSANFEFVENGEDEIPVYPMPGDLKERPGYLNEQYFEVGSLPSVSDESKWTDKASVYSDSKKIGESSESYAGMIPYGQTGIAEKGYKYNGKTHVLFDWIEYNKTDAKMIKKTWGYIVPEEDMDRIALFTDDGVYMEIKEVNPATGEKNLIAKFGRFRQQEWAGASSPILNLKKGKAYDIYIEYFNWGGNGRMVMLYNGNEGNDYYDSRAQSAGKSTIQTTYNNLIKDKRSQREKIYLDYYNRISYTDGTSSRTMKLIPPEWFRPTHSTIDATDLKNAIDKGNYINDKMSETGTDGQLIYGKNFDSELYNKLNQTLAKAEEIYNGRYKQFNGLDYGTVRTMFEELLKRKDKDELKSRHVDAKYRALIDGKTIGNVQDLIDAMTIITREATLDFKNSIRMTGMEAEWDGRDAYTLSWDEFKGASGYEVYFTPKGQSQAVRINTSSISNMENGRLVCTYASSGYADGKFKVRAVLDPQEFTIDRTGFSNEANGAGVSSNNMMKGRDGYNLDQGNSITTYYGTNIVPSVEFDIYSTDIYKPELEISVKGNDVLTYKYPKIEVYKGTMTTIEVNKKKMRVLNDRVSVGAKTIIEKDEQNNLYKIRIELQNDQNQKLAKLERGTYVVEIDTSVLTDEQTIRQVMAVAKKDKWRFPYEIQNLNYNGKSIVEGLAVDAKLKWKSNAESSDSFENANDPDVNVFENDTIQIKLTNKNELPGSF